MGHYKLHIIVICKTQYVKIAFFLQYRFFVFFFGTSRKDGNIRQIVTTHVADLDIAECHLPEDALREDGILVDVAFAEYIQVSARLFLVHQQDDVLIAVAVHVCHIKAHVSRTGIGSVALNNPLMQASHRDTVEDCNLFAHVHHDFLHAVARLVLNAAEVESTCEVLGSDI